MEGSSDKSGAVYGVCLDEIKQRYWLLLDDGTVNPKPDDLLGLQPLLSTADSEFVVRNRLIDGTKRGGSRT